MLESHDLRDAGWKWIAGRFAWLDPLTKTLHGEAAALRIEMKRRRETTAVAA